MIFLFLPIVLFAEDNVPDIKTNILLIEDMLEVDQDSIINEIEDITENIIVPDGSYPKRGYYNIALGFSQIRDFESALEYAKKIVKQKDRDELYYNLVKEMLISRLENKALKVIEEITDKYYIELSYNEIIQWLITHKNDYEQAMHYAELYQSPSGKGRTRFLVILDMIQDTNLDGLVILYQNYHSSEDQGYNIMDQIISVYLYKNDLEGLRNFMKKANIEMNDKNIKKILSQIARKNKVFLLNDLSDMVDALNSKDKVKIYTDMACNLVKNYKYKEAYKVFDKIQDFQNRDEVYLEFAENYLDEGNIDKALSYEDSIKTVRMRDRLYMNCTTNLINRGAIDEAIILMYKINDLNHKERRASDIAKNLFIWGDTERFEEIVGIISDTKQKDNLYENIIYYLLKHSEYQQIEEYLIKISSVRIQDRVLRIIAEKFLRSNELEKAKDYASRIADEEEQNEVLEEIEKKRNWGK